MKKICLLSDHHLCINPRLWKEAFLYEKMGFDVVIITKWQSKSLLDRDFDLLENHEIEYLCYLNIIKGQISFLKLFLIRLLRRLGSELKKKLNIEVSWSINHAPNLLYHKALSINADFYSAHLESGFYAGVKLLKSGKKVSFDFEDWYSQDYLVDDRPIRTLAKLEKHAMRFSDFCTAASHSMANGLSEIYGASKVPFVIYNSFPDLSNLDSYNKWKDGSTHFVWTSRTVGPARGIEELLSVMKLMKSAFTLHIIGDCSKDYRDFLLSHFSDTNDKRLKLYDFVSHEQLQVMLPQFDFGLAMEQRINKNRDNTVTNKILQYLQAGLQVISTETQGQIEVASKLPEYVHICDFNKIQLSADKIDLVISSMNIYDKEDLRKKYESNFGWLKQETKLRQIISYNI